MSSTDSPVLVTGATGKQGGATTYALRTAGVPVRALVRDTKKATQLAALGAEILVGDLNDEDAVARAVDGVRGVFSVQMPRATTAGLDHDQEVLQATTLITRARAAGVRHFVQSSISGVGQHVELMARDDRDWGQTEQKFDAKGRIQNELRVAGFERWTILKPGTFMENFAPSAAYMFPRGLRGGLVTTLRPDTELALTAVDDIGAAAASAFEHPERFHEVELELASDRKTMTEVTVALSDALGVRISAPDMTEDEAMEAGMPPIGAAHAWLNAHGQPARPKYARALGVPLTSFEEWTDAHLPETGARS